jgi:hypothetical protein
MKKETTWRKSKNPLTRLLTLEGMVSDRKLRLFACGCARLHQERMTSHGQQAVEAAERFADDLAGYSKMITAGSAVAAIFQAWEFEDYHEDSPASLPSCAEDGVARATAYANAWQAATSVMRISALSTPVKVRDKMYQGVLEEVFGDPYAPPPIDPAWLAWNDRTIPKLARAIYQECAFERMPILGDALEEAGCHDPAILEHCRADQETHQHFRGCWVLDLLGADNPLPGTEAEEGPDLILPRSAWLVTPRQKDKASVVPPGEAIRPHQIDILGNAALGALVAREQEKKTLEENPLVRSVKEVWFLTADGRGKPDDGPLGKLEEGPMGRAWRTAEGPLGRVWLYNNRDKAMRDLGEVYEPVRVLLELGRRGPRHVREIALEALAGKRTALPTLVRVLAEAEDPRTPVLRRLLPEDAAAAKAGDVALEKAREEVAKGICPGCGKANSRNAYRVQKAGANQGRLFARCTECDRFDWLTNAPVAVQSSGEGASPAAAPAQTDTELAELQARATPCPRCGKPRKALRVRKEGPNQGRLFLGCSDRNCNSFEWAGAVPPRQSSPPVVNQPTDPIETLMQALRAQYPRCINCDTENPVVARATRPGANQGRIFMKCNACNRFDWLTDKDGDLVEIDFE